MSSLPPSSDPSVAPLPSETILDVDVLRALTEGDDAFLRELSAEFANSAARVAEELATALAAGDLRTLAEAAHRFKSAAGQVGARRAQDLSAALERVGRAALAGSDAEVALAESRAVVTTLLPVLAALEDALRRLAADGVDPAAAEDLPTDA